MKNKIETMKLYDDLADWYDILVPITEGYDREFVEYLHNEIFERHGVSSILDCACGTGAQSIGLTKLGYDIVSSDLNLKLLQKANANAERYGTNLKLVNVGWDKLSDVFGQRTFDAVLCAGNCLYHYASDTEKLRYLTEMCAVLRKGGVCFVDFERWDKNFQEIGRERFVLYHHIENNSRNIICSSVYEHEGRKQILTLYFMIEENKHVQIKTIEAQGYAFTMRELFNLAKQAGFSETQAVRRPGIWKLNAMLAIK